MPLNIEHIVPRAKGGTNRVSNLVIACVECNQKKAARSIEEFLHGKPELLKRIKTQLRTPLKDAASVNTTRWALFEQLKATGLPVLTGSGAQTKFNRHVFGVEKEHWLDALCVGRINGVSDFEELKILQIRCTGRGAYQRTRLNRYGFPRGYLMRQKKVHGFATGDMVKAIVPKGKLKGIHTGRVAVRQSGKFNIQKQNETVQGVNWKYCRLLSNNDGYGYEWFRHSPHSSRL